MVHLDKADLEQMTDDYLQSLEPERLVAVAKNLRALAVAQLEKLEESSKTSSRPPPSDSPYQTRPKPDTEISPAAEESESVDLGLLAEGSSEVSAVETKAEESESSAPAPPQGAKDLSVAAPVSNREPRGNGEINPYRPCGQFPIIQSNVRPVMRR